MLEPFIMDLFQSQAKKRKEIIKMADLCIVMFYVGGFCLLLSVGYYLLGVVMFCIYKFFDHGKMSFWKYMKQWD